MAGEDALGPAGEPGQLQAARLLDRPASEKPHPHVGPNTKRIEGVETTNYRVAARLLEMKLEDDHDIHPVIAVPRAPAKTMIVEFPNTTCTAPRAHRRRRRWRTPGFP
jgi:hypothetical protein